MEIIKGYSVGINSTVYKESSRLVSRECDKSAFSSEELAKASLAIAQLSQLREVARDGWIPNWITIGNKYCIGFSLGRPHILHTSQRNHFLSFQSKEIAEEFLEKYRCLIEQARPILG